jgi:FkbM family methyltransferase
VHSLIERLHKFRYFLISRLISKSHRKQNLESQIAAFSIAEYESSLRFLNLVQDLDVNFTIEVGAFDAEFSKVAVGLKSVTESWAFEASPFVYHRFKELVPKKLNYVNLAINNYSGECKFQLQSEYLDHSLVSNNSVKHRNELKPYEYISVPCSSLDLYFSKVSKKRIALWIDAEGANREILLGGATLLDQVVAIFVETELQNYWLDSWLHEDVEKFLSNKGFYLFHKNEQYFAQTNCIFLRRN